MAIESFQPQHHDNIEFGDIELQREANRIAREAKFEDDLRVFRANVYTKMLNEGAIENGSGWAVYRYSEESDDPQTTMPQYKEVLVMARPNSDTGIYGCNMDVPTIRIISNELIRTSYGTEWLTKDFIADNEDDTQFFVGCLEDSKLRNVGGNRAVVFNVDPEGNLCSTRNFHVFSPVIGVYHEDLDTAGTEANPTPFGHYTCLEDKTYALERGSDILNEIADRQPSFVYAGIY